MNSQQHLVAERNGTVRRIISLESVVVAALLGRKPIERLQTEILALRARVRALDHELRDA